MKVSVEETSVKAFTEASVEVSVEVAFRGSDFRGIFHEKFRGSYFHASMEAFTASMKASMELMKASVEAVEASMEAMEASTEAFMNFHKKFR